MKEKSSQEVIFKAAYNLINKKANSNSFIQGVSGIAGFPTTLAIDGIVIFSHYEPMIDEIRTLFGYAPLDRDAVKPLINSIGNEIMVDIVVDKVLGQIPVAGVYFNAICAKALTWRLGMLFTVVSSRGEEMNYDNMNKVIKLICNITPQTDMFKFSRPDYNMFKKITISVYRSDFVSYDQKIENALHAFD